MSNKKPSTSSTNPEAPRTTPASPVEETKPPVPIETANEVAPDAPDGPRVNVGVLGHQDHGGTELTAAITKILSLVGHAAFRSFEDVVSAFQEYRHEGVRMTTLRVAYQTDARQYTHLDCLTQADCIKSILSGVARMDGAILVVSTADGPMEQTREMVQLAQQAQVPAMVVFMSRIEQVDDPELRDLVEIEIRDLLIECGFPGEDVPVVRGSTQAVLDSTSRDPGAPEYEPIWELLHAMDEAIPTPVPAVDRPFLMPIEDAFSIKGRGTVVTGRVERGKIYVGEEVEIVGLKDTRKTIVTGVEMYQKLLDQGQAGDNIGCLLRAIGREDVERGMVLAAPGSIEPLATFEAQVYVLTGEEGGRPNNPFFDGNRRQFHFPGADVTGEIELPPGIQMAIPGDSVEIRVELVAPLALEARARLSIRDRGRTVAVGIVTQLIR